MLPAVLLGLVIVAGWQAATQSGLVSSFFLPRPAAVALALWDSFASESMLSYTLTTLKESLAGSVVGVAVALPLGYAIANSRIVYLAVQPYVAATQAVPAIALAPLLVLWLGYGLLPIAVLCAVLVFFPMLVNTVLGLRVIDRDVVDSARVDGAGRWRLLWFIQVPLALPHLLAGIRNGLTLSITGAVVGEFVAGGEGLGQLLLVQRDSADSAGLFATLVTLALLASGLYGAMLALEKTLSRWRS